MKTTIIGLLLLATASVNAQEKAQTYQLADAPRYSEETGYGYDLVVTPEKGSKAPFFPSVRVSDGNYQVTVRLGSKKQAGVVTVRDESRRLFIDNLAAKKGQFVGETFIINKRNLRVPEKESVRIKPREKAKLNWDDKPTLELNDDAPVRQSISIEPADPSVITIFLCGNSIVVDQDNEPWVSWGQMTSHFFGTDVCIASYAESGESANTFIAAGRSERVLSRIKRGDYPSVEFGRNDQRQKGLGKEAYYSFMTSLKTFIDEARARGAYPVLIIPIQRRSFDATGHIRDTHEDYPEAMHWLAAKESASLTDLNEMTRMLYEALGTETSRRTFVHYPVGIYPGRIKVFEDNTHFNPHGAYQVAQRVIEGMKKAIPELTKHLKIDSSYNPAQSDDVNGFYWSESLFTETEKPDGN